jgi:hypothetical protein
MIATRSTITAASSTKMTSHPTTSVFFTTHPPALAPAPQAPSGRPGSSGARVGRLPPSLGLKVRVEGGAEFSYQLGLKALGEFALASGYHLVDPCTGLHHCDR